MRPCKDVAEKFSKLKFFGGIIKVKAFGRPDWMEQINISERITCYFSGMCLVHVDVSVVEIRMLFCLCFTMICLLTYYKAIKFTQRIRHMQD